MGVDKLLIQARNWPAACLFLCLVLLSISGCNSAKQGRINEKANEVYQNLYVPDDAVVLGKVENDRLLAYGHGCTGTVIEIAYGVNRSLTEIIEEYHQSLLKDGWELHPDYNPNRTDTTAVYRMNPRTNLRILSSPVNIIPPTLKPNEQSFVTIYAIMIVYTEPSNANCIG